MCTVTGFANLTSCVVQSDVSESPLSTTSTSLVTCWVGGSKYPQKGKDAFSVQSEVFLLFTAEKTFSKRVTRCGMHKCLWELCSRLGHSTEVLCGTFSTDPQPCCTHGPAVGVVPGGSCVCLQVGATCSLTVLWVHTSSGQVAWWHDGRCPALPLEGGGGLLGLVQATAVLWTDSSGGVQGTDAFFWLLPLCTRLQRMVQVYFWPMKHRKVLETQREWRKMGWYGFLPIFNFVVFTAASVHLCILTSQMPGSL